MSTHNTSSSSSSSSNSNITVPYNTSLILVSLVAFLSPIATLLVHQTIKINNDHHHHHDVINDQEYQFRYLQIQCGINSTTTESTELLPTWQAIQTTTYIAAAVAFLCLLGYELFRRDPIIGKYVYDRKRLTQPGRSPPPLMLSRSLWRGYDDDDEDEERGKKHQSLCCKVRPAILELLFLNLDKNYIRYSRAADEARKERERRGYYECCRTGCFHNNCCSNHGKRLMKKCPGIDFTVDEDGYAFYPGFSQDYSHIYQVENEYSIIQYSPQKKLKQSVSLTSARDPFLEDGGGSIVPKKRWTQNIGDLFPEDDRRHYFASHEPNGTRNLFVGNSISNESLAWDVEESGTPRAQSKSELSCDEVHQDQSSGSIGSTQPAKSVDNCVTKDEANEELNALIEETGNSEYDNAVSGEDGRQISQNAGAVDSTKTIEDEETKEDLHTEPFKKPSSMADSACTTNGNGEQTEKGTKDILNSDANKMNSPLSIESTTIRHNGHFGTEFGNNNDTGDIMEESTRNTEAGTEMPLKYPSRLKYIFMPPGFHTVS